MRRHELPLILLWTTLMVAPGLGVGYLRDDWLLLWRGLDPAGAPAGAAGVFPRPLAELQWWMTAQVLGDAPWAMHAWSLLGWLVVGGLLWGWMRRRPGAPDAFDLDRFLVVAWGLSHAALVETRLWAAAGNGVWAMALALAGAHLFGRRRTTALLLFLCAALFRADALVLLALPLTRRRDLTRRDSVPWRGAVLVLVAGAVGLATMLHFGGQWTVDPADAGRALRRLLFPFGAPLPALAASLLAGVAAAAALFLLARHRRRRRALLGLALAGSLAATALSSWSPAGRYLLAPVVLTALLLEPIARAARSWRLLRPVLVGLLILQAGAAYVGSTATRIRETAAHETALYRAVRDREVLPGEPLRVADPPEMGWRGSPADLENIVSAARRRPIEVEILLGEPADAQLRFRDGGWHWTDVGPVGEDAANRLD